MENQNEIDDNKKYILIKGDISGIQEFIFNVKSKNAAKTIKAKSFFIKTVSIISVEYLFNRFGVQEANKGNNTISVSGGNFFITLPSLKDAEIIIDEYSSKINLSLKDVGLSVIISFVYLNPSDYPLMLKNLNQSGSIRKYKLLKGIPFNKIFDPFSKRDDYNWIDFSTSLKDAKSFIIENKGINDELRLSQNTIELLSYKLKIIKEETNDSKFSLKERSDTYFPSDNYGIKSFEDLAGKTGTSSKLGILKMDVDNLGTIFSSVDCQNNHKKLSEKFRIFFEGEIYKLIQKKYQGLIYTLLAGGDDCFFVGAWDKTIELAFDINKNFNDYWENQSIKPTLSAGLVIVHSKFPVVRFAEMAENALYKAKVNCETKNSISLFNTVIKWDDWNDIEDIKSKLRVFVPRNAKSLLMNARKAVLNKNSIEKVELSDFWELAYYLREIRDKGMGKELNEILSQFEKLIDLSINKNDVRYRFFFPIAARLIELQIRN